MKEYLTELVRRAEPGQARNMAREYLQARILEALQRSGAMIPLAFQGGTALRFLYGLPRYSEDLDFTLERPSAAYDLRSYLDSIRAAFETEAYRVDLRLDDRRTVHSAWVRFPGLPHDLGLSPFADEILAVKIEVDTNPPAGAGLVTTVVRRYVVLQVQHHDRASLLAGKIHALLSRPYEKGRDFYDLLWYLGDPTWPPPNLALLNNALLQTGWAGGPLQRDNWRQVVRLKIETANWERVLADVRPFLEAQAIDMLTRENVLRLLG